VKFKYLRLTVKGKVVPVFNYVPWHEDILCSINHHGMKTPVFS